MRDKNNIEIITKNNGRFPNIEEMQKYATQAVDKIKKYFERKKTPVTVAPGKMEDKGDASFYINFQS